MIKAEVVADSINDLGNRITTMVVTFPRIILAEFNTHRAFSRNSASSRAIPFEKMVYAVESNPFVPIAFQKHHKGMQGSEYITDPKEISSAQLSWLQALDDAVEQATKLYEKGVTKQICNRLLEPFMWHTCIVTSTEWENFFKLRCPKYKVSRITRADIKSFDLINGGVSLVSNDIEDRFYRSRKDLLEENTFAFPMTGLQWLQINEGQAEIHMMALAEAMWDAYNESTPKKLKLGEWHIPFEDKMVEYNTRGEFEDGVTMSEYKAKIATTMAARTSYTVVGEDQKSLTYDKMIQIHDKMKEADPFHASPFEHCAMSANPTVTSRNFTGGWLQYRQVIEEGFSF